MTLFDLEPPNDDGSPHSISEIAAHIKAVLTSDANLQDVWITGEVSGMKQAASGHWYFTLKDEKATLRCVMWRSSAARQRITPKDGDAIEAYGSVNMYEVRGDVQFYATAVRPVGAGDLYQQFERLKAKLAAEGLFDGERKRQFPFPPKQIGIVTSPDAAAFQDMLNVLQRRYPLVEVILSPAQVQGDTAPPQIVDAIGRLNAYTGVDVILVARGGGSIEDLWAFNDEAVARAVADSRIPVITGVGHETDFTIVDFVSDLRAPTPSAAAELAVPDLADLRDSLYRLTESLDGLAVDGILTRRNDLESAQRTLNYNSPVGVINNVRQRIDDLNARIAAANRSQLVLLRERLTSRTAALEAASPQAILERGYAIITRSDDDSRVTGQIDAPPGTGISIKLKDGELKARVEDEESHGQYRRKLF